MAQLRALVRRSPRVLAFEWVPLTRPEWLCSFCTEVSNIYIYRMKYFLLFFFLSSVARFTFCLAPGERKASRSGKSSGAWPFVGFHLSLPSDATHARLLSIPSVLPISFCVLWCAAAATGAAAACATAALCAAYASAAAACAGTAACSATAAYAASDSATVAAGLHHSCVVFRR